MYIFKISKSYEYFRDQVNNLFNSLVMYGIEVWGAAYLQKYLGKTDRLLKRVRGFSFQRNCVLRRWESETLK